MPDELSQDLHVKAVLLMIPFYPEKLATLGVSLQVNGKPFSKDTSKEQLQAAFSKPNTIVSFTDAENKQRVYYKLIADSDSSVAPSQYSVSHDASAFVEVDKNGKEIIKLKTGKANVIISFPGLNNAVGGGFFNSDFMDAAQDNRSNTSYEEKFFNDFMAKVTPQLKARGLSHEDAQVVSHSLGDKHAAEYVTRYSGSKAMMIDGWDKEGASEGAILRATLKKNSQRSLSEAEFKALYTANMAKLVAGITEVNAKPTNKLGSTAYHVTDGGHMIKNFMHLTPDRLVSINEKPDMKAMLNHAFNGTDGVNQGHNRYMNTVESSFLECVSNQFNSDGKITADEKTALGKLREKLAESGIQVADMQAAQRLYFPADNTEKPVKGR